MAQMCVGQPCAPTNVIWKGRIVRNLPDRVQQGGCTNRSIMRPTTADSLGWEGTKLFVGFDAHLFHHARPIGAGSFDPNRELFGRAGQRDAARLQCMLAYLRESNDARIPCST